MNSFLGICFENSFVNSIRKKVILAIISSFSLGIYSKVPPRVSAKLYRKLLQIFFTEYININPSWNRFGNSFKSCFGSLCMSSTNSFKISFEKYWKNFLRYSFKSSFENSSKKSSMISFKNFFGNIFFRKFIGIFLQGFRR